MLGITVRCRRYAVQFDVPAPPRKTARTSSGRFAVQYDKQERARIVETFSLAQHGTWAATYWARSCTLRAGAKDDGYREVLEGVASVLSEGVASVPSPVPGGRRPDVR